MSNTDSTIYYPEDYDYSIYYQNQMRKYQNSLHTNAQQRMNSKSKNPSINYFNERKCPIYVHHIRKDSSVYNHYNAKYTRKPAAPQNPSKLVLDKLEETYWATWKPRKEHPVDGQQKNVAKFEIYKANTMIDESREALKKEMNRGDVIKDNVVKYFRAKQFESGSTIEAEAAHHEGPLGKLGQKKSENLENKSNKKLVRPSNSRRMKVVKEDSVCLEDQIEAHCPIILNSEESEETTIFPESLDQEEHLEKASDKVEDWNRRNDDERKKQTKNEKASKAKSKKGQKSATKTPKKEPKKQEIVSKIDENSNNDYDGSEHSIVTFVDHKDSIEIAKKKQEESGQKEHFQQPKCIRLYRKSGLPSPGYIKGGTYPLKSCLKKDSGYKGNFRLGPPGSPIFITSSSFSNRKRK